LYRGQQGDIITYRPVVDPGLKNIVILDASNEIRRLCSVNKDLKRLSMNKGVVSYSGVTIHQLFCHSGRHSVERYSAQLGSTDSGVLKEVVFVVKNTPKDRAILIVTFKAHEHGKDHIKALRKSLQKNGINPDEMITVLEEGRPIQKRRIQYLTWGNETSLNRLSYCSTVILAGILQRNPAHLASSIVGEKENLCGDITSEELNDTHISEVCHCIYQSLSRGSCRIVKDGKAGEMEAWIIYKDTDIRPLIDRAMPGVQWKEWTPVQILKKPRKNPKQPKRAKLIADRIITYLQGLPPGTLKVSVKQIKRDLGLSSEASSTVQRAFTLIKDHSIWVKEGNWLVNRFAS
jgi:hypothetical protein